MTFVFRNLIVVLFLIVACPGVLCAEDRELKRSEFDGFSFCVPEGWKTAAPDREKTKASLLHYGKSYFFANGLIKVDVGQPVDKDPTKIAKMLAGEGGKVDEKAVQVDGAAGYRVQTTSKDFTRPQLGLVIIRGELMYLIMSSAKNGFDTADAFDTVIDTWKWDK